MALEVGRSLLVEQAEIFDTDTGTRIEGTVAGQVLHWEVSSHPTLELRGEPFVGALLAAAMRRGLPIELPENTPLDPTFLKNIERMQEILARWFKDLKEIPIRCTVSPRTATVASRATGFSGGIDSSYSIDTLGGGLDAALLIHGIEYSNPQDELIRSVTERLKATISARGLQLVTVTTNVKAAGKIFGADWGVALGGALASAIHAVGFQRYAVAASNSWEHLRPYGSHPLTDPLWSSSAVHITHHGCERTRVEKLRYLAQTPDLLDCLRVCFQGTAYNCGVCQKCLMTAAGLRAIRVHSSAMPELKDVTLLRKVFIEHYGDLVDWEDLLVPGLKSSDPELYRELTRLTKRFRFRETIKELDQATTRGVLRSLLRRAT